jgi:hypothetical protein
VSRQELKKEVIFEQRTEVRKGTTLIVERKALQVEKTERAKALRQECLWNGVWRNTCSVSVMVNLEHSCSIVLTIVVRDVIRSQILQSWNRSLILFSLVWKVIGDLNNGVE